MNRMVEQVYSLPDLIKGIISPFDEMIRKTLDHNICLSTKRLYLTGCGDSHHAALNTELAFEALTGLPVEPMTAMQFSHYGVPYLPDSGPGSNLVIGISVSGEVARTVEALNLANKAGATTVALTATVGSRADQSAQYTVLSTTPPFPDPPGTYTPGVRSFAANQLALYLIAIRIGEVRGSISSKRAADLRAQLANLAPAAQEIIQGCDPVARELTQEWKDAKEFVFAGSGPNYGIALFSAAKVLEASGDPAIGQEIEEWAHLQYFAKEAATPTFIISPGGRELARATEVVTAARAIGRRLAVIAPHASTQLIAQAQYLLPLPEGINELFSPVLTALPGELVAAYRAEVIDEPFFRNFTGGRSVEHGGGISRIRTSDMLEDIPA